MHARNKLSHLNMLALQKLALVLLSLFGLNLINAVMPIQPVGRRRWSSAVCTP